MTGAPRQAGRLSYNSGMCGRYALTTSVELLVELFGLAGYVDLEARYNVAPTQDAPVVRVNRETGERNMEMLRWGLIPRWAKDAGVGARAINARSETVAEKPTFREAMRARRCLVPADAFYEWKKNGGRGSREKQPFCIRLRDGGPFALAGLWERWCPPAPEGEPEDAPAIESFTVLTTSPNALVEPLHDRMPVIVEPKDFERWLDPNADDVDALRPLLRPLDAGLMTAFPVSRRVNSPRNDDRTCIEPVPVADESAAGEDGDDGGQGRLF